MVGYLENPASSRVWLTPRLQQMKEDGKVWMTSLHMCQYGTPWKKSTTLMIFGVPANSFEFNKCKATRSGICSRSHQNHIVLRGTDGQGKFLSAQAQVYPTQFARALAEKLEPFM